MPLVVGLFSVSPICSSYLLYKNAQRLNDRSACSKAKNWMIAGLAVWLLSVICSLAYPTNTAMVNGFFFWYLILWYFLFVRQQVANMRATLWRKLCALYPL